MGTGNSFMLAISGILLLIIAFGVFRWTLAHGVYHRYPYEQFILVGGSALIGLAAVLEAPSPFPIALFAVELGAFGLLLFYMSVGARFRREKIPLSVGDRFPDFSLRSADGDIVDSRSTRGKTSLFLFYRGPW